jgi:nicotinamidase-related amidase
MSGDALLIIDVQTNTFSPPAWRIDEVAARLDAKAPEARERGVPVIFIQHGEAAGSWQTGSPGWRFDPRLAPRPGDIVVAKSFCDGFRDTELQATLDRLGIDRLIVGGYASEFCVDTTVRAAASREIETVVLADCHTTHDRKHLAAETIVRHHTVVWAGFDAPLSVAACRDVAFR